MRALLIEKKHWEAMRRHVEAQAPLEACGLLGGKNSQVESAHEIRNQEQSPVKFVMDPTDQLNAFNWMDSNEQELLAIYHSHPAGPETVSVTDIAEARYPVVYIVWFRKGDNWDARGFWIEDGQASETTLQIV